MDTQYYTTTTSPALPVAEELVDIPSEHITGERDKFSKVASRLVDIDLKLIYHAFWEAIRKDHRGDEDGRVYTVAYKIYDIEAVHHFEPITEMRYDVFSGRYEDVHIGDEESIEIMSVRDINGRAYPGHLTNLRNYAETKQFIIMKTRIEVKSLATGKVITSHEENRRMTAKEIEKAKRDCMRNLDPAKVTFPEVHYID